MSEKIILSKWESILNEYMNEIIKRAGCKYKAYCYLDGLEIRLSNRYYEFELIYRNVGKIKVPLLLNGEAVITITKEFIDEDVLNLHKKLKTFFPSQEYYVIHIDDYIHDFSVLKM